jgi:hypothetical protein
MTRSLCVSVVCSPARGSALVTFASKDAATHAKSAYDCVCAFVTFVCASIDVTPHLSGKTIQLGDVDYNVSLFWNNSACIACVRDLRLA